MMRFGKVRGLFILNMLGFYAAGERYFVRWFSDILGMYFDKVYGKAWAVVFLAPSNFRLILRNEVF